MLLLSAIGHPLACHVVFTYVIYFHTGILFSLVVTMFFCEFCNGRLVYYILCQLKIIPVDISIIKYSSPALINPIVVRQLMFNVAKLLSHLC